MHLPSYVPVQNIIVKRFLSQRKLLLSAVAQYVFLIFPVAFDTTPFAYTYAPPTTGAADGPLSPVHRKLTRFST